MRLSGDEEFKKSVKEMQGQLGNLKTAMAATSAEFKNNEGSVVGLRQKQDILSKQVRASQEIYSQAIAHLERYKAEHGESSAAVVRMTDEVNRAKAELFNYKNGLADVDAQLAKALQQEASYSKSLEASRESLTGIEKSLSVYNSELKAVEKQYAQNQDTTQQASAKQEILSKAYEQSKAAVAELDKQMGILRQTTGENSDEFKETEIQLNNAKTKMYEFENSIQSVNLKLEEAKEKESEHAKSLEASRESLKSMDKTLAVYDSQLEAIEKQYSKNGVASQQAAAKQEVLKTAYEQSKSVVAELDKQMEILRATVDVNSDEFKQLEIDLNNAKAKMYEFENSIVSASEKLYATGQKLEDIGGKLTKYVSSSILVLGTAAGKASIDFESAFAGVMKTIDTTVEGYERLRQGLLDMDIPVAPSVRAGVAEIAGQLGIAEENVVSFTRTIIDMGESTNMTVDKASSEMARFANITQMPQENFNRLGSTIVALGNNLATTESEISAMGLNLAAAGKQAGFAASDTMAYAGTLSSLGVEAEKGGTAMSKLIREITASVDAGGDELNEFAKIAGVSADTFTKKFKDDAAGAIALFIEGLGRIKTNGGNLNTTLNDLGITESRMVDVVSRLALSGDLLTNSLELSKKAWTENTALTTEAGKRYETTASQIQALWSDIQELGIELGDVMVPTVRDVISTLRELVQGFTNMDDDTKKLVITLGAVTASIGPIVTGIGKLITTVTTVQGAINVMNTGAAASTAAMANMAAGMTLAKGAATGLAASLKAVTGLSMAPLLVIVAAIGTAAVLVKKHFDDLEESRQELIHAGDEISRLQEELNNVSSKQNTIDSLSASWKKLSVEIKSAAGISVDLTAKKQELAIVEQKLIELSGGLITSYDIENNTIGNKITLLESQVKLEQDLARLKMEQILSSTSGEIIQHEIDSLEERRKKLIETNNEQTAAYTRFIELAREYSGMTDEEKWNASKLKEEVYELAEAFDVSAVHATELLESPGDNAMKKKLLETGGALATVTDELIAAQKTQVTYNNALAQSEAKADGFTKAVEDTEAAVVDVTIANEDFEKKLSGLINEVKSLEGAVSDLTKGEALNQDQLFELIDTYPELAKYLAETGDLTFDNGEIAKIAAANRREAIKTEMTAEAERLRVVVANAKASFEATKVEFEGKIKAAAAYYGVYGSTYTAITAEEKAAYEAQKAALEAAQIELDNIEAKIRVVDSLTTLSAEKSSSRSKAENKAYQEAVKNLEYRAEVEELTNAELIEGYERVLKEFAKSEDEKMAITKKIVALRKKEEDDIYQEAVKNLENRAEVEAMTNTEMIEGYKQVLNEFAKSEDAKLAMTKKISELQKDEVKRFGEAAVEALKKYYETAKEKELDKLRDAKDAEREQVSIVSEYTKEKIQILTDEYIERVRMIDETTAAQLKSCNEQIKAEIERISLIDAELGRELEARYAKIDALNAEIEAERQAVDEKRQLEKIVSLEAKIQAAEELEDRIAFEKELQDYKDELALKAKEKRLKDMQEEAKNLKESQLKEIDTIKSGIEEQQKLQEVSLKSLTDKIDGTRTEDGLIKQITDSYDADINRASELAARMFASGDIKELEALIKTFNPDWESAGKGFMDFLDEIQKSAAEYSPEDAVMFNTKRIEDNYESIKGLVSEQAEAVEESIGYMSNNILALMDELTKDMYDSGKHTGEGYLLGLSHKAPQIIAEAQRIAAAIRQSFASALGIASPSKVFRQFGQNTGEGWILGLKDTERDVIAAAKRLAGSIRIEAETMNNLAVGGQGGVFNSIDNNYSDTGGNVTLSIDKFVNNTDKDVNVLCEELGFINRKAKQSIGRRRR